MRRTYCSRSKWSWEMCVFVGVAAVVGLNAQFQQRAVADEAPQPEGPIVQIGPVAEGAADVVTAEEAEQPAPVGYWVGIRGRGVEDPVLRTQLQLAENMGVVIEEVVPDSPAQKAGLRKHDIVLRANGDAVSSMVVLQEHVTKSKDQPIELKILRLGQELDIAVTPETRPADFNQKVEEVPGPGAGLDQLLRQFQGGAGGLRVFGPGMVLRGNRIDLDAMPNGMSVSITRENNGPAQITVTQGEKSWTLRSDDAQALAELPAEVRTFVEGMLNGQAVDWRKEFGNLDWQAELRHMLPDRLGNLPGMADIAPQQDQLQQRMKQLEDQLQQLQQRLDSGEIAPPEPAAP